MTRRKSVIPDIRVALQQAIDTVKRSSRHKGATDEDIAAALGIPVSALHACLEGKEKIPASMPSRLLDAFSIVVERIDITETKEVEEPDDVPQTMEELWQTIRHIVIVVQETAKTQGKTVTLEDMANVAGIPVQQLQNYLDGKAPVPAALPGKLMEYYLPLLNSNIEDDRRAALAQTLVLVRNAGLAKGMDITLKDMAEKLGLPVERIRSYLYGEWDAGKDLSALLRNSYSNIVSDKNTVTIKEDIHAILSM